MTVIVTETAAREIHNIILQQDLDPEKIRLRVGVKGGGCSGFSYLLDLTETQKDSDEMWEFTYDADSRRSGTGQPASAGSSASPGSGESVAIAEPAVADKFTL